MGERDGSHMACLRPACETLAEGRTSWIIYLSCSHLLNRFMSFREWFLKKHLCRKHQSPCPFYFWEYYLCYSKQPVCMYRFCRYKLSTVGAEFNISKIFFKEKGMFLAVIAWKRHIGAGNAKGNLRGSMVEQSRFSALRWVRLLACSSD